MSLTKSEKQSYESYFVYGDFSEVMQDGESIVSGTCTAVDNSDADATEEVLQSGSEIIGSGDDYAKLYVRVQDGIEELSPYKITIRIVTSNGNRWEVDGLLVILEK